MLALVESAAGERVVEASQAWTAAPAPAAIAGAVDLRPGDPLLQLDQVYLNASGAPVEFARNFFNPDRSVYTVRLLRRAQ